MTKATIAKVDKVDVKLFVPSRWKKAKILMELRDTTYLLILLALYLVYLYTQSLDVPHPLLVGMIGGVLIGSLFCLMAEGDDKPNLLS